MLLSLFHLMLPSLWYLLEARYTCPHRVAVTTAACLHVDANSNLRSRNRANKHSQWVVKRAVFRHRTIRLAVAMNDIATNRTAEKQFEFDDLRPTSPGGRPEDEHEIERPTSTVEEILRQVQRELCLIKLCWPDVSTEDAYVQSLPDTYRCVSDKERLLLWYAENFRRQIHARYAARRPLLLACENECRVQVGKIRSRKSYVILD